MLEFSMGSLGGWILLSWVSPESVTFKVADCSREIMCGESPAWNCID